MTKHFFHKIFVFIALTLSLRGGEGGEDVDVAIIETNHGGEFDSTNFVTEPVVTAITTLGMDHIEQLGPTQANIAWHKAGIFKKGVVPTLPVEYDSSDAKGLLGELKSFEAAVSDVASQYLKLLEQK